MAAPSPGTLKFKELATSAATPAPGYAIIYVKTDNVVYLKDSSGTEVALGSASSITSLTGEATAVGPGAAAVTLSNSAVIGKVLTGFTSGPNSTVLATDTILQAFQKLQAQVTATVGAAVTSLTGDVTGTGPGATATTVAFVGGETAADISTSVNDTQAATSSNTASTIVKRDASGNFSANVITASLTGNVTGNVSGTAANVTGIVAIANGGTNSSAALNNNRVMQSLGGAIVEANAITANRALISDSNGIPTHSVTTSTELGYVSGVTSSIQTQLNAVSGSAITALTGDVSATGPGSVAATVNSVGGSSAANINTAELAANAATSANTFGTIVKRDGSGNILVTNINGVAPEAHASRHLPTGADPLTTATAITLTPNLANATGTANSLSRSDHAHNVPSGSVVQIGTSNFDGAAASFALSDHVHSHGAQTSGTLHAAATTSVNGFMSAADKTKLDNATDANTPSTLVLRDASGNFSAGVITLTAGTAIGTTGTQTLSNKTLDNTNTVTLKDTLFTLQDDGDATKQVQFQLSGITTATTRTFTLPDTSDQIATAQMTTAFKTKVVALTDAATIATDASLGNIFTVTLGGNRTLGAPTNPTDGQKITYRIRQDATGSRTLAYNAVFNFPPSLAGLSLSTSPNVFDYLGCQYNSTNSKWDVLAFTSGLS